MERNARTGSYPGIGCQLIAMVLAAGCGYHPPGPPLTVPTATIEGAITCGDIPVSRGWITFVPLEATLGDHVMVPITSGKFQAAAPRGLLEVRLSVPYDAVSPRPGREAPLARQLAQLRHGSSAVRVNTRDGSSRFDFDLLRLATAP